VGVIGGTQGEGGRTDGKSERTGGGIGLSGVGKHSSKKKSRVDRGSGISVRKKEGKGIIEAIRQSVGFWKSVTVGKGGGEAQECEGIVIRRVQEWGGRKFFTAKGGESG